jgi:hypothetical protein
METISQALTKCGTPTPTEQPWDQRQGTATVEPEQETEAPPPVSRWQKMKAYARDLVAREKASAKSEYLRLLKISTTRDLSEKENQSLFAAMKEAGITTEKHDANLALLESIQPAREAAERKKVADDAARAAHAALVAHERNVFLPAKEQHEILFRAADEASGSANVHRGSADKLQNIEEQIAKLFGESV